MVFANVVVVLIRVLSVERSLVNDVGVGPVDVNNGWKVAALLRRKFNRLNYRILSIFWDRYFLCIGAVVDPGVHFYRDIDVRM